jgi:hypothetical protein
MRRTLRRLASGRHPAYCQVRPCGRRTVWHVQLWSWNGPSSAWSCERCLSRLERLHGSIVLRRP